MDPRIEQVCRFLEANCARDNADAARLARRVGLSASRFHHLFKSETGVSPRGYTRTLRLREAERLLRESSRSMKEIADAAGFGSPPGFSRIFRKHYGVSPREFRLRAAVAKTDKK